jgi:hypothetical protein
MTDIIAETIKSLRARLREIEGEQRSIMARYKELEKDKPKIHKAILKLQG